MNQREVFVIHKRSLYAHRVYKDPLRRDLTFSRTTNPDLLPDSGDAPVSFVVDWQLQVLDLQGFGRESTHDTLTAFYRRSIENRNPERESTAKERSTYISDW
ncbi:MAG TPA: hypothetical protein VN249_07530 [Prolixibacteraceae bacterium]|nr:hypothetical protein [Prolixibacteraceae bacterium]